LQAPTSEPATNPPINDAFLPIRTSPHLVPPPNYVPETGNSSVKLSENPQRVLKLRKETGDTLNLKSVYPSLQFRVYCAFYILACRHQPGVFGLNAS
jgi:hypothetical protein